MTVHQTVNIGNGVDTIHQTVTIGGYSNGLNRVADIGVLTSVQMNGGPFVAYTVGAGEIVYGCIMSDVVDTGQGYNAALSIDALDPINAQELTTLFGDDSGDRVRTFDAPALAGDIIYGSWTGPRYLWQASQNLTGYGSYNVLPTGANRGNNHWYMTTPGITGAVAPNWLAAEGAGVLIDGTVEWTLGSLNTVIGSGQIHLLIAQIG